MLKLANASLGATFLLALTAQSALADAPIRSSEIVDFTLRATNTSRVCGFDVYRRITGTFTITAFTRDRYGVVREIDGAVNAAVTWFAPAKGTSYSYPLNSPTRYDYPQGGSIGAPATLTFMGLNERIPGTPASAGLAVYEGVVVALSEEGIPLVITSAEPVRGVGSAGGTLQDRCAALAG